MFCMLISPYVSRNNSNLEKQVVLLLIQNGNGWHYSAVKILSALLIGITSKHYCDFYCLNYFHSIRTKNKLKSHKKVFQNKNFCHVYYLSKS